jgi:polyvinyl alcohol dehydrogenase (cytochrome)
MDFMWYILSETTMKLNLFFALFLSAALWAQSQNGEAVYKAHCAVCHDNSKQTRAPDREVMKQRTPEAVFASLTSGTMAAQGTALSEAEKRAVAESITGKKFGESAAASGAQAGMCAEKPAFKDPAAGPMWNGWGADLSESHYQPAKAAGLTADQVPKLKLKWAFGFPNGTLAFAQPIVVSGRVFIGSDKGVFYSLDASSGCTYWSFKAEAGVRAAASVVKLKGNPAKYAVYFGDLKANVYGLNAATGEPLWRVQVDDHRFARVSGSPALEGERLYVPVSSIEEVSGANAKYECCKFRGSVVALDINTGKQIWKNYTIPEEPKPLKKNSAGTQLYGPAGGAVWSAPTVDLKRRAIYVGSGNAYTVPAAETSDSVVAFDMDSGKLLWARQATPKDAFLIGCRKGNENCPEDVGPDYDFGTSPILRNLPGGKRILVIGQKSGVAWGLDPDKQGKIVWQFRAGKGGALGGIEWGIAADEEQAYIPVSDVLQPGPEAGGLYALKLATGEKVWNTPAPKLNCEGNAPGCTGAQSAPIAVIPGVVFSGSVDGHFRAYSSKDGSIIWDFNTAQEFPTVNQVKAKGGSLDAGGPAIVGGMVFTNSGYGMWRGMAGNVLLAFAP